MELVSHNFVTQIKQSFTLIQTLKYSEFLE